MKRGSTKTRNEHTDWVLHVSTAAVLVSDGDKHIIYCSNELWRQEHSSLLKGLPKLLISIFAPAANFNRRLVRHNRFNVQELLTRKFQKRLLAHIQFTRISLFSIIVAISIQHYENEGVFHFNPCGCKSREVALNTKWLWIQIQAEKKKRTHQQRAAKIYFAKKMIPRVLAECCGIS